ncbi:hypothetical protein V8G54_034954 [Vigna mungo]|uniref:Uncharacterized protein n=1 Tax=Vigna mungo TaxID=3915 RepID=A0AAQ3RF64_VIGMU
MNSRLTWSSLQTSLARVVFPEPPIPEIPTTQRSSLPTIISLTLIFPNSNPTAELPSTTFSSTLLTASSTQPPPPTPILMFPKYCSRRRTELSTRSKRSAISKRVWWTSAMMWACMGPRRNFETVFSSLSIFLARWRLR